MAASPFSVLVYLFNKIYSAFCENQFFRVFFPRFSHFSAFAPIFRTSGI